MIRTRHFKSFWQLTAMVVMLQLIVAQVMAASGSFHKQCHEHADDPAHECVVTLILGGGYAAVVPDSVPMDIVSEPPRGPVFAPIAVNTVPSHLAGGVLAHAPPRGP
jgi:hypothetical protein